jgi:hypothetical protein
MEEQEIVQVDFLDMLVQPTLEEVVVAIWLLILAVVKAVQAL